jgi:hypothetical protein
MRGVVGASSFSHPKPTETNRNQPTETHQPTPQARLKAFSAALERVAATAQRMPPPSATLLRGFRFGQHALASSTADMLSGISKFQAVYNQMFPRVAQFSG